MSVRFSNSIHTETVEVQEVPTRAITPPLKAYKRPGRSSGKELNLSFLRFEFEGEKTVDVPAASYIIVGRQEGNERKVDLDLTPLGGLKNGVSRTHVIIQVTSEAVFIRDYNSRNGTFLNNAELYPMRDYSLEDGDVLWLGNIMMRVLFC